METTLLVVGDCCFARLWLLKGFLYLYFLSTLHRAFTSYKRTYQHGFYVYRNCHPVLVKRAGVGKKNYDVASCTNGKRKSNHVL